ncbi:DUF4293 domain-containing protein [Deminuibacter soli]|uniref:DUF4293 family protein n=1 Tax=Deminuibacter soli TaxID=2291815 RepID=A0A3E1NEC3_9BACT|nr:DUF4293 domain-containing protein [Deminuibacter soli]RFM26192.1 DUF4293 family protein [Deminuibacter soli]
MIQRVQTIWLLLASAVAFLTLKLSFFSGNKMVNNVKTFISLDARESLVLTILTVAVAIASLVAIFLYKDRKRQVLVTVITALVSIINIVVYVTEAKKFVPNEGKYDLTSILAVAIPIFLLLAIRGMRRDEKLIKSVDRLR